MPAEEHDEGLAQATLDEGVADAFDALFNALGVAKPGDRSEKDRFYAIISTDLEKAWAYFLTYVLEPED